MSGVSGKSDMSRVSGKGGGGWEEADLDAPVDAGRHVDAHDHVEEEPQHLRPTPRNRGVSMDEEGEGGP